MINGNVEDFGNSGAEMDESVESVVILHCYQEITLTSCTTTHNCQNLPARFGTRAINLEMDAVSLRVKDGRVFKCGLYLYVNKERLKKGYYETRFSSGWKKFCSDMELKGGDKITLEVHGVKNVMRVTVGGLEEAVKAKCRSKNVSVMQFNVVYKKHLVMLMFFRS